MHAVAGLARYVTQHARPSARRRRTAQHNNPAEPRPTLLLPDPLLCRMVVNGVAIGSDYDKLFLYICTASSASPKPDACYDLPERMRHQG